MNHCRNMLIIVWLFSAARSGYCQFPEFEHNDRVCFIGNSITMDGRFFNFIELFYATRYPERKIEFYNCGIAGDVAKGVLSRMEKDILIHRPTWSVLMIGMNDVNRNLYSNARKNEPGISDKQKQALERYYANVDSIIIRLLKSGSKVILQTPTIYDQTAVLPIENYPGVNDALKKCAEYLKSRAVLYKIPVVDYWTMLDNINKKLQAVNPGSTIISGDRVHPGAQGHFQMAYEFLSAQRVKKIVSYLSVKKQRILRSSHIEIRDLSFNSNSISFNCTEESLAYPYFEEEPYADSLCRFTEELNRKIIQLKSIRKGNYALRIDSVLVGSYKSSDLKKGINLAHNILTPQYLQSLKVLKLYLKQWDLRNKLRLLKYVEYQHFKDAKNFNDTAEIRKYFSADLEARKDQPQEYLNFYRQSYENYLQVKPREEAIQKELDSLAAETRKASLPVSYSYQFSRVPRKSL